MKTFDHTLLLLALILAFILQAMSISAQKIKKAEGEFQVKVERNMTREEALRKAVELAKINAIENVFGTYVEQQANLTVQSGKSDFYIVGSTKVKGIWVKETDLQFTEEYREEKGAFGNEKILWITCRIKGEVRQVTPRPAVEYAVQNCPLPACRTTSFFSGEQLYLRFKSPVDGYISVFLDDGEMVYRLLPYIAMLNSNNFNIKGDEEYLFFETKERKGLQTGVTPDQVELYTLKEKEYNKLILVFSTIDFFKPGLTREINTPNRYIIPKALDKKSFEYWLSDLRANLDDVADIEIPVEIGSRQK